MQNSDRGHRIGFGSSRLRSGSERMNSTRLIEIALKNGITHFDTAPSYGMGLSENILGDVLHPVRKNITIATKIGISRPSAPEQLTALREIVKPIALYIPGIKSIALKGMQSMSRNNEFDAQSVQMSIEQSLTRLKTDYIDYLLLHEPAGNSLSDELLFILDHFMNLGLIKHIGTSTGGFYSEIVKCGTVGQFRYEPGLASDFKEFNETFLHGVTKNGGFLEKIKKTDPEKLRLISERHDVDLINESNHVAFIIAAVAASTKATPIYATNNPTHLENALQHGFKLKNIHLLRDSLQDLLG